MVENVGVPVGIMFVWKLKLHLPEEIIEGALGHLGGRTVTIAMVRLINYWLLQLIRPIRYRSRPTNFNCISGSNLARSACLCGWVTQYTGLTTVVDI